MSNPTPVRLDNLEEAWLLYLKKETGLSKSDLLRRAFRYAGPRFVSKEIAILDQKEMPPPPKSN